MCIAAPDKNLWYIHSASEGWQLYFTVSVALPLFSLVVALHWSRNKWGNHPISKSIGTHALPQSSWRAVSSSINTEFRRIDKFATGAPGARVIVTDTWVMKVTTYYLHVAQQQDIHLTVIDSKQHELSPDSDTPVQILTITVASINPNVKSFDIRLNSTDYGELREKLHAPIRNAANVVIHQTLSDLFLETFKSHVEVNQIYSLPSGMVLGNIRSDGRQVLLKVRTGAWPRDRSRFLILWAYTFTKFWRSWSHALAACRFMPTPSCCGCARMRVSTRANANSATAVPCGASPAWASGLPADRTSSTLRPGWPAGCPARPVGPNSAF
ncbi:E3 ubiquitin-protein ligase TM129 isoform X3 [Conger conger]|nr:E3 ubiquitin-protein ligase TM129 isoform X3 [Conger conger]